MATITADYPGRLTGGWLRSARFDGVFLLGGAAIGCAAAIAASIEPQLFLILLYADLWLLGYHHVISTSTRLMWDRESARQHKALLTWLPLAVLAATVALAAGIGFWTITTIYFYWQWFHYTRQSWGISRGYARKEAGSSLLGDRALHALFWLAPIWGVLHRSAQDAPKFLGQDIWFAPVPAGLADAVGVVALAGMAVWAADRLIAWRQGTLALGSTIYMATHFAMFMIGYILIADTSIGWLAVNIWHNLQYILFVWLFNAKRFQDGVDPKARLLSYLSQRQNVRLYFVVSLLVTFAVYLFLSKAAEPLTLAAGLPAVLIIYQAINFHHYIVDSVLWKSRRAAPRAA